MDNESMRLLVLGFGEAPVVVPSRCTLADLPGCFLMAVLDLIGWVCCAVKA